MVIFRVVSEKGAINVRWGRKRKRNGIKGSKKAKCLLPFRDPCDSMYLVKIGNYAIFDRKNPRKTGIKL